MVRGAAQVLVVALGSVLAGLPTPAAAQNRIEVRDESTGPPLQTVRIALSDTDASSSKHVLLSRPGGKESVEVKLQALIDGVGVTFTPADVAIPAEGRPVLVTIEVTKATAGSKTGEILAQGDPIAKLEVHKAAATPVTLVGADASTGLTLKTEVADFRYTFRVASNVAESTEVRLTPSLFADPTGAQVQPSLELTGAATLGPIKFDVAGGQSVPVILGLATPLSGDYSGTLELAFGSLVNRCR